MQTVKLACRSELELNKYVIKQWDIPGDPDHKPDLSKNINVARVIQWLMGAWNRLNTWNVSRCFCKIQI